MPVGQQIMPVSCNPEDLAGEAACFTCGLSEQQISGIQTYLLAKIAGGSTDPTVLLSEARCFLCLNEDQKRSIQVNLLCKILNL